MSPITTLLARCRHFLRGIFRRHEVERELQQELDDYLDLLVDQKLAQGMTPHAARRAARLEFGGLEQVKERVRDVRLSAWFEHAAQELRRSLRSLARSPGYALVVVLTLGVGIGANAAAFSFVKSMILRPLPFLEADRLVSVQETSPPAPVFVTAGDYVDWKENNRVFETLSGYTYLAYALTERSGLSGPELLYVAATSSDFFRTLRVQPLLGRTFLPGEDEAGREQVVVLGHGLWTRRFGSNPGIVGREVTLDGRSHTVIGVMPADFDFPVGGFDAWTPMVVTEAQRNDRRDHSVMTVGRLRPGVTLQQAHAEMEALGAHLAASYPQTNTGRGVKVLELRHQQGEFVGPFLVLGQAAALFVLLIACANVSNLQIARAATKGREMALRAALGAGRWHLGQLAVMESVLLALVGSGIGIAVAAWGVSALKESVAPEMARWILGFRHIGVDWTVLAFSLAVAIFAGLVFGLLAASEAWRHGVMDKLREGSPAGTIHRAFLRRALVSAEVGLALVVTVSAGQTIQGFQSLVSSSRGFSAEGVATMWIRLQEARFEDPQQVHAFYDEVLTSASAAPGVESAGLVSVLPAGLISGPSVEFRIEGLSEPGPGEAPVADLQTASADYFRTVGIPLIDGRAFDERDRTEGGGEPTVVISNRLARLYWPGENPLGKRLRLHDSATGGDWLRVVGVVGDVRQKWFEAERPFLYLSAMQSVSRDMFLTVRGAGTVERLLSGTIQALRRSDPNMAVFDPRPLSAAADEATGGIREAASVMGVFGALALLLSAVGVYGLTAYSVGQREREFGIRMALGAAPRAVLAMVVRQGMRMAAVGLCLGVPVVVLTTRLLSSSLFGAGAGGTVVTVGASSLVCAAVLVACYLPARLVTRVDPIRALRCD